MTYRFMALMLAFGCASPVLAQDCDLTAGASGSGLQNIYDPFAPQNTVVDLRINVSNAGSDTCQARFFVAPTGGQPQLSAAGSTMTYRVEGMNSGSSPGEYGPFAVQVPPGGSQNLSIQFTVQAQQVVPVGFYTGMLTLRGEDPSNHSIPIGGTVPTITMAVPARSEISISGAPSPNLSSVGMAPATINFPDAQTGQIGRVYVNVWANANVLVSLTSENGGALKNLAAPSLPPIAYTATFDGASLPLTSVQTLTRTPPLSVQGASYELAITLGDVSRAYAGRYRDRITVDVNAN